MTSTTMTPTRSLEQRMDALQRANEVRTARAQWKRDLKAGRIDVLTPRSMVLSPPWWAETMKVFDLLLATPKIGRVKAIKALSQTGCSMAKTLGGLSTRQRMELARLLPAPADRQDRIRRAA